MAKRSEGRVALITGGARGIGAATAERLAEDGAAIAIADLDGAGAEATAKELAASLGVPAIGLKCDVSQAAEVDRTVTQIVERLGSLDILVNNAGITRDNLIHKMSDEDWELPRCISGAPSSARGPRSARWLSAIGGGSSTCPRSRRWEIAARPIIRPRKPGCRAWPAPWRSSSDATVSPPTLSR